MKVASTLLAALLAAAAPGPAAAAAPGGASTRAAQAADVHKATGVVKRVDAARRTVTVTHAPVASLKWPAMTMDFKLREPGTAARLRPGDRIEFEFVEAAGDYLIIRLDPAR